MPAHPGIRGLAQPPVTANQRAADRGRAAHLAGRADVGTLSHADLSALMHEVIHDVREATGWRVALPAHQVMTRAQVVEALMHELPANASAQRRGDLATQAPLFAERTYAYYDASRRRIVLVADNVRRLNHDTLRGILHHELVHAAQHQRFPRFMAQADRMVALQAEGTDAERATAARCHYSMLKLIEGHAHLLEQRARKQYYPQAERPAHTSWLEDLFHLRADREARRAFLQSPYAGAQELEALERHAPLDTVVTRLFGDLNATLHAFRPPGERGA